MLQATWDEIKAIAKKHDMDPDRLEYLQNCRCEFCLDELARLKIPLLATAAPKVPIEEEPEENEIPVPKAAFLKRAKKAKSDTRNETIRARRAAGEPVYALAKDFKLTKARVYDICRGVKVAGLESERPEPSDAEAAVS